MSIIHAPEENRLDLRQMVVPAIILACMLVFLVRLFFLQVILAEGFAEEAQRSATRSVATLAPRGQIFDRSGRTVAGVKPTWVVRAIPSVVKDQPESLEEAARILQVDKKQLEKELKDAVYPSLPTDIFVNATLTQAMRIAEARSLLPSFDVEMRALRQIVEPFAYTHILGYVSKPNTQIIEALEKQGIIPAEYVGRDGIERAYEKSLMGQAGTEVLAVDARSRPISRLEEKEPTAGSSLYLTIDTELQKAAMKAMKGFKGAVAAIDPNNGEVIAFFSSPTYDLKKWEGGISKKDFDALRNDERDPMSSRPTAGLYSPGSTFKIVTALAAAREGVLEPNHYEFCNGGAKVGSRLVACKNHSRGMSLNFASAFRLSCNTYFVNLALKVGPEKLRQAALDLGLGKDTGLDLPFERSGNLPNGVSVKEMTQTRRWYQGDTANFGIGQGDTLVTPLQMAQVAAVIAMDGRAYRPHFVRAVQSLTDPSPVPVEPEVTLNTEAPAGFWDELKAAMRTVIASGTARRAQIPGVVWGGKTGSTQHGRGRKTHSWFVGIAPLDNPKIAIAVLAEEAGHGGDVAAPAAAQVAAKWLQLEEASSKAAKPLVTASRSSLRPGSSSDLP